MQLSRFMANKRRPRGRKMHGMGAHITVHRYINTSRSVEILEVTTVAISIMKYFYNYRRKTEYQGDVLEKDEKKCGTSC